MQLGMIGLGRMGANMVHRLLRGGHQCVVFDAHPDRVKALARAGATAAVSLDEFVRTLTKPRAAWVMVPADEPTEQTVMALAQRMDAGDIIIDGGNSYFKDDVRRANALKSRQIQYVDVGTSGGIWGLERGYCLMIGAQRPQSSIWNHSSRRLRQGQTIFPVPPVANSLAARRRMATCTVARWARVISSKWSTTALSTA